METIFIKQREIYLSPFPFFDLSQNKVRPILILSNNNFNKSSEDTIICGITSNLNRLNNYNIKVTDKNLEEGYFITDSCIKPENILKIEQKILIKKIAKLNQDTFKLVLSNINLIFK